MNEWKGELGLDWINPQAAKREPEPEPEFGLHCTEESINTRTAVHCSLHRTTHRTVLHTSLASDGEMPQPATS